MGTSWPSFKSFWMIQDRYLITIKIIWDGTETATVSLYRDGEIFTDGNLYGNDF